MAMQTRESVSLQEKCGECAGQCEIYFDQLSELGSADLRVVARNMDPRYVTLASDLDIEGEYRRTANQLVADLGMVGCKLSNTQIAQNLRQLPPS